MKDNLFKKYKFLCLLFNRFTTIDCVIFVCINWVLLSNKKSIFLINRADNTYKNKWHYINNADF